MSDRPGASGPAKLPARERVRDITLGVLLQLAFIGVSAGLIVLSTYLLSRPADAGDSTLGDLLACLVGSGPFILLVVNLVALIVIARRRSSIALGMLLVWAASFALALIAGALLTVWCFASLGNL